ncbi:MAG: RHS repeat-associated core domain-containing protein [Rhizomicrobium sp.]
MPVRAGRSQHRQRRRLLHPHRPPEPPPEDHRRLGNPRLGRAFDPFGNEASVTGTLTNPLRFPGQYQDTETNLAQNWFRDYDSTIGRYAESDPVGLWGGMDTYGYASSNPLILFDPWGLANLNLFNPATSNYLWQQANQWKSEQLLFNIWTRQLSRSGGQPRESADASAVGQLDKARQKFPQPDSISRCLRYW